MADQSTPTIQQKGGNVGIGTASPSHKLQVSGQSIAIVNPNTPASTSGADAYLWLGGSAVPAYIKAFPGDWYGQNYRLEIGTQASTTSQKTYMTFFTEGSERMRITSEGNVGINTTSPSVLLHLENSNSTYTAPSVTNVPCIYVNNSNSSSSTAHAILVLRTLGGNGGNPFISFDINGVQGWAMGIDNADGDKFKLNYGWSSLNSATRLTFETGGNATFSANVTASAFFESSDIRLKSNIYTYTPNSILDVVAKVYEKNGKLEVGYIAQDLKGVLDSAISEREDGMLDLSYRQVHTAKIAALEAKIKQLESQLKNK